jgi:hypothetical protein
MSYQHLQRIQQHVGQDHDDVTANMRPDFFDLQEIQTGELQDQMTILRQVDFKGGLECHAPAHIVRLTWMLSLVSPIISLTAVLPHLHLLCLVVLT